MHINLAIEPFYTLREAAKRLNLPYFKLQRAAKRGLIPVHRFFNSRPLVRLSEVEAAILCIPAKGVRND